MAVSHGTHGPALDAAIDGFFAHLYGRHKPFWGQFYKTVNTKKRWAEFLSLSGFSTLAEREIGAATQHEDPGVGYLVQVETASYGKKMSIYEETKDDDINGVAKDFTRLLYEAARETEAVLAHTVLNDGFSVNGYDGVPLFSASHPQIGGGTFSNLITAADLSLLLLEDYMIAIADAQDDNGKQIHLKPKLLLVPTEETWTAKELLGSSGRPDSDFNGINPAHNFVPWMASPYLTDPDATIMFTDCPSGGVCVKKKMPFLRHDNDNDTLAMITWIHMRMVFTYLNPRWAWGCRGA